MNHYTRRVGGEVIDLLDLNLPLLIGFENGLYDLRGGGTKRNLGDDKGLVIIGFSDTRPDLHRSAPFTIVVLGDINDTPRRKIGVKSEVFISQVR